MAVNVDIICWVFPVIRDLSLRQSIALAFWLNSHLPGALPLHIDASTPPDLIGCKFNPQSSTGGIVERSVLFGLHRCTATNTPCNLLTLFQMRMLSIAARSRRTW